ncbi:hypothetical protein [Oceanicella actignis]|uniref:hypothetical protein n=1 Tax=Oceanicella actignis TaxID=1189325 RepID=UPI0011E7BDD0|nr:hypothetical protein [Oceanicella actignis]TYO90898.1 hypothetical protein LY05_01034 [Oceanicella actignis]
MAIPVISVKGVVLGWALTRRRIAALRARGVPADEAERRVNPAAAAGKADWRILAGGLGFAAFTATAVLSDPP